MKYFNLFLIISSLILVSNNLEATPQISDLIIIQEDTLSLYALPLEPYLEEKQLDIVNILESKGYGFSTGCYRRYQGLWKLRNDSLFLLSIQACAPRGLAPKIDISLIFDQGKLKGHSIFANWYSDTLIITTGKEIYYKHWGWGGFYEKEIELAMKNGKVINRNEYDNSKSHVSKYEKNSELLHEYFRSQINWKTIPPIDSIERVFVQIIQNDPNDISVKIVKSNNPRLNSEALRVARLIDDWTVIYSRGKRLTWVLTVPIVFRESDRRN